MRTPSPLIGAALAVLCVLLAVSDFSAIWPYQLSRWIICGGSVVLGVRSAHIWWRSRVSFAIAVVFNPIAPIQFGGAWPVVDWLAAVLLLLLAPPDWSATPALLQRALQPARRMWDACVIVVFVGGTAALLLLLLWDISSGRMAKRDAEQSYAKAQQYSRYVPTAEEGARWNAEWDASIERANAAHKENASRFWSEYLQRTKNEEARLGRKLMSEEISQIAAEVRRQTATPAPR